MFRGRGWIIASAVALAIVVASLVFGWYRVAFSLGAVLGSVVLFIGTIVVFALMVAAVHGSLALLNVLRFWIASLRPKTIIVPPPSREESAAAARERRAFLAENMARSEETRREILEHPPEFPFVDHRELSRSEAIAQSCIFRWQMEDEAFLLLGRVVDAVSLLSRRFNIEPHHIATTVKLERPSTRLGARSPYLVIIESKERDLLASEFGNFQSWLGVAVAIQKPGQISPLGKCAVGGGKYGCVGGYVTSPFDATRWLVTCAHVLAANCNSASFRSELKSETNEPDVAVLMDNNPCFSYSRPGMPVVALNEDAARLWQIRTQPFVRVPGPSGRGLIHSVALWASYENRVHKFPHAEIGPDLKIWLDLVPWPIWGRRFSKKGHSGSWVIERQGNAWLGLLVAGNKFFGLSYVALAHPLLDFIEKAANLGAGIQPFAGTSK